jgi:hypothetical protein
MSLAAAAQAQGPSCNVSAAQKNLAGAAKTSFLKKCEAEAKLGCEAQAANKHLAGAAKTSFLKKCVSDAVGQ